MNSELIKFIELCLTDGVISDKEREVIFRKAKELDVPEDECEIILEGMSRNANKETRQPNLASATETNIDSQQAEIHLREIINKDESFVSKLDDFINHIKYELDLITPESFSQDFKMWLSKCQENLVYHFDEKASHNTGFYPKNGEIPSHSGSIYGFNKYEGPPTNERIIGEIEKDFKNSNKMYCLTPTHLIEITKQFHQSISQQIFGGSSYKYKFGEKLAINELDIFAQDSPLTRFLDIYCKKIVNLELHSYIKNFQLKYQADWTMSHLKNLTNEQGKRLSKVCIELEKVSNTLTQICQNQIDSIKCFYPYWVKPLVVSFDINTNFISFINAIELCSKTLASIISIKNEMLLAVIEDNNTRFEYLVTKLEDSGIFMTYFENQSLEKSDEMIKTLKEGFASVSGALLEIGSGLNNLNQGLTNVLNELNENVRMNNILQGIQSYQLYRLNKS